MVKYERFFDRFDKHNHGYIMATQIGQIMRAMDQEFDERTLRRLIRKFDADGSGKIEFDEFCALVYTVANSVDKETLRRELREAFRLFDKEGNGYISTITLKELLQEIAPDLSSEELASAVDDIDQDGSGKIEFEDYLRLRVLRFTRSNALQYNFSVPLPSHNVEISINYLDIVNFDTNAFQSRLGVISTKELVWIGSEFRAAINTQIQLKMLIERRELFATQQVPLRLEKVRIELVLGPGVNADGHLRTGKLPFTAPQLSPVQINGGGTVGGKKGVNPIKNKMMASFQLSNYTFASLFFWMDQYRKFDYEISQSTIKDPEVAGYLRTECGAKEICAGTLFPALSQNFPNGVVAIRSRTINFPSVLFERGKAVVLVESKIDAFVNHSSQQQNRRFLSANMYAKLNLQNATFLDYLFRAELAIDTFEISNVVIDGIDAGSIEFLVNALNELIIAEDMKRKLQDGIKMPVLLDFEQIGPGLIRFEDGMLLLGADFCFEENCIKQEKSLLMLAESQQSLDMDANYYDIST
uniref:EF-hand domain-containing protein n=1 Tax=Meloidogyne javanica TaxID=6303 RepID=A0A915LYV5_MELJA